MVPRNVSFDQSKCSGESRMVGHNVWNPRNNIKHRCNRAMITAHKLYINTSSRNKPGCYLRCIPETLQIRTAAGKMFGQYSVTPRRNAIFLLASAEAECGLLPQLHNVSFPAHTCTMVGMMECSPQNQPRTASITNYNHNIFL